MLTLVERDSFVSIVMARVQRQLLSTCEKREEEDDFHVNV